DQDCQSEYCEDGRCADADEKDSDGDGMPDWYEEKYGLDPNDPSDASQDANNDGMLNLQKYEYRKLSKSDTPLNPHKSDYDEDGVDDLKEIKDNTDATDSSDFKKAKWWSILLFIFAFIIVGGALGYFGYTRYMVKQKKTSKPGMPPMNPQALHGLQMSRGIPGQQAPSPGGPFHPTMMPKMRHRMTLREKLKDALKNKVIESRKESISKEHGILTSAFDDEKRPQNQDIDVGVLHSRLQNIKEKIKKSGIDSDEQAINNKGHRDDATPAEPESPMDAIKSFISKPVKEITEGSVEALKKINTKKEPETAYQKIEKLHGESHPDMPHSDKSLDSLSDIIHGTTKKIEKNPNKTSSQKAVMDKLKRMEKKKKGAKKE
ncbi:MAG: hypothetical protein ACOCWQ_01530, partial [Nanoarchaeota archaeon]